MNHKAYFKIPLKMLDQIYKAIVRSHLDYCDIIYHQPAKVNQTPLGVTAPMVEIELIQYQAALAIRVLGRAQVVSNCTTSMAGNPYQIDVGVVAHCNFIKYKTIALFGYKKSFHPIA